MKIKISLQHFCILVVYLLSYPVSARVTVVEYTCQGDKPLTVSYFLGKATQNATAVFDNIPHKMYYDPTSTQIAMVFRETPYSLHVERNGDITQAILINVIKESQGEKLHDTILNSHCVPK